ncbi:unnamed protein product [Amoebophrya sp. A25]|nr:unnamed protein product [Amoebophrya sp. A25]|eukprot:GSA25T00002182001.1
MSSSSTFFRTNTTMRGLALAATLFSTAPVVDARSRKVINGIPDTIRPSCPRGPPTEEQTHSRVEFGDKVFIKLSAYHENPESAEGMEYSPDLAEQEVMVGRARLPILNEFLTGMCPNEVRRIFTWVQPKIKAGPLAYIVELKEIIAKGALFSADGTEKAEVEESVYPKEKVDEQAAEAEAKTRGFGHDEL